MDIQEMNDTIRMFRQRLETEKRINQKLKNRIKALEDEKKIYESYGESDELDDFLSLSGGSVTSGSGLEDGYNEYK